MSGFLFETPRLRGRRWRVQDFDALVAVYGDSQVVRWVADGRPLTAQRVREWMAITDDNYRTRGYGMFALEDRATGEVVGFCGLVHPAGQVEPEVKYAFRRSHWGRGLASEAVPALLAYGARCHGLARIVATVSPEHVASHRVLLKAGAIPGALVTHDDGSATQHFEWHAPDAGA